eukprot:EG_transcript_46054
MVKVRGIRVSRSGTVARWKRLVRLSVGGGGTGRPPPVGRTPATARLSALARLQHSTMAITPLRNSPVVNRTTIAVAAAAPHPWPGHRQPPRPARWHCRHRHASRCRGCRLRPQRHAWHTCRPGPRATDHHRLN